MGLYQINTFTFIYIDKHARFESVPHDFSTIFNLVCTYDLTIQHPPFIKKLKKKTINECFPSTALLLFPLFDW